MLEVQTEVAGRAGHKYLVAIMPSSIPGKSYRVDVTNGRCDCAAWKFSKIGANGQRPACKHLRALGYGTEQGTLFPDIAPQVVEPREPFAPDPAIKAKYTWMKPLVLEPYTA